MKQMYLLLMVISLTLSSAIFAQTDLDYKISGVKTPCPGVEYFYTADNFNTSSGCSFVWTISNGYFGFNSEGKKITTQETRQPNINAFWDELSYINEHAGTIGEQKYYNIGEFPSGAISVKIKGTDCGTASATLPVAIISVKGYQMYGINCNNTAYQPNETYLFSLDQQSAKITCSFAQMYLPNGSLIIPSQFKWRLPQGWYSVEYHGSEFISTTNQITLIPPCWGYNYGDVVDLIVWAGNPQGCQTNNQLQTGAPFILKLWIGKPEIISISSQNLNWGATQNFTITATTNSSNPLKYHWHLPYGYTSNGMSGVVITDVPNIQVKSSGCNYNESVGLHIEKPNCVGASKTVYQKVNWTFPTFGGGTTICASGTTYYVVNAPYGSQIGWSYTPNIEMVGQTSSYATFKALTNNEVGTVSATVYSVNGCYYSLSKNPDVGTQMPGPISYEMDAPPMRFTTFTTGSNSTTSYNWYSDGVLNQIHHSDAAIFTRVPPYCGGMYDISVEGINACGVSSKRWGRVDEKPCGKSSSIVEFNQINNEISISPNPADKTFVIESINPLIPADVKLYDSFGSLIYEETHVVIPINIVTNEFKSGIYFLRVQQGNDVTVKKVIVKH